MLPLTPTEFQDIVWDYYRTNGRHDLPWRSPALTAQFNPYNIMVSELMLQQTQVVRVIPKYLAFIEKFPTVASLAAADLGEVLRLWSGLGYNRRAKFLHQAAQMVVQEYGGEFPATQSELVALPGVGLNTAGAIAAYAYNQPASFIETNIRTVYIHHYFQDHREVTDKQLQPIITETIDQEHPREWYWALMDYGSFLKGTVGNLNKLSVTYSKQSAFEGSRRQIRGKVLKLLGQQHLTRQVLYDTIGDDRLDSVLEDLLTEKLIYLKSGSYHL